MLTESTTSDPVEPDRRRPSTCSPRTRGGLRAKVLATQARVLSGYGKLRRGAGRRPRRAGAGREARPARAGLRRDHHAEPAQEGRTQGRAPLGAGRGGPPRGRLRRHPGRAPRPLLPGSLLRGLGRVGAGRDVVPQRHEGRRRRGHPLRAVGLRVPVAGGLDQERRRRLGRGAAADRHQRRAGAADPVRAGREHRAGGRVRPRRAGGRAGPGAAPVLGARGRRRDQLGRRRDGRRRAAGRPDQGDRGLPGRRRGAQPDLARVVQRPHPARGDHDRRGRRLDASAQRRRADRPAGRGRAPAR